MIVGLLDLCFLFRYPECHDGRAASAFFFFGYARLTLLFLYVCFGLFNDAFMTYDTRCIRYGMGLRSVWI
jgi:hypothetical protein